MALSPLGPQNGEERGGAGGQAWALPSGRSQFKFGPCCVSPVKPLNFSDLGFPSATKKETTSNSATLPEEETSMCSVLVEVGAAVKCRRIASGSQAQWLKATANVGHRRRLVRNVREAWLRVWLRVPHGCIRSQPGLHNLKARPRLESPVQVAQGQCQLVPRASVPPHAAPAQSLCVLTACRLPSLEPVTQKTKADATVSFVACVRSHMPTGPWTLIHPVGRYAEASRPGGEHPGNHLRGWLL